MATPRQTANIRTFFRARLFLKKGYCGFEAPPLRAPQLAGFSSRLARAVFSDGFRAYSRCGLKLKFRKVSCGWRCARSGGRAKIRAAPAQAALPYRQSLGRAAGISTACGLLRFMRSSLWRRRIFLTSFTMSSSMDLYMSSLSTLTIMSGP